MTIWQVYRSSLTHLQASVTHRTCQNQHQISTTSCNIVYMHSEAAMARPEDQLSISFKAMQRMRTTIEDFVQSYFPYAGLSVPQDLFKYLDVLLWVEGTIYQLDEDNEALARVGQLEPGRCLLGESVLPAVLAKQGLLDAAIQEQLKQGDVYWQGERRLCALMLQRAGAKHQQASSKLSDHVDDSGHSLKPEGFPLGGHTAATRDSQTIGTTGLDDERAPKRQHLLTSQRATPTVLGHDMLTTHGQGQLVAEQDTGDLQSLRVIATDQEPFSLEDVLQVHEAKSFDYRLLHLLLRKLSRAPADQLLMDFLFIDELLVDIGDDLVDYEDDVEANSFNILRAYVYLYGTDAPLKLVERISELEELHSKLLAELPADLQRHYWSRHTEAEKEGGQGSGRWVFPPLILDEVAFRQGLEQQQQRLTRQVL